MYQDKPWEFEYPLKSDRILVYDWEGKIAPILLEQVNDNFKKDKEVTLQAIKQCADAFKFVHEELKNDKDILHAALEGNTNCYNDPLDWIGDD